MNKSGPEGGKRRSHKTRWIALAVVAVLVVGGSLYLALRESEVEKRLAALRAAGYPTSFAEMEEYNRLPEGVENAAGVYTEAFNAFVRPSDAAELPVRGEPLPEAMVEAMSEYMEESQECLALLHKAGGIEHCLYEDDYATGMATYLSEARECLKLIQVVAILSADQGDADGAVGYLDDGLRLSDSLAGKPFLFSHVVRVDCIGMSLSGLERALGVTAFSDGQLRELDEMLSRTAATLDLANALATERSEVIAIFRDPAVLSRMENRTKALSIPVIGKTGLIDYLDYMADCMEALELAGMQRIVRLHEIEREMESLSFLHVVGKMITPGMAHIAEIDLRGRAHIDLARTAIAIERYRLAKGELPERLEELVGEYLEAVPVDPFDGEAIKYRRAERGYVLYSVGMDGKDDGGKERKTKKRGEPYDLTFIVTR